ncbi:MAG: HNH endonuclease signature motif containing protein [Bacteroidota bacterium]
MSRYISNKLRKQVYERAYHCCEYCLAYEGHSFIKFQIEHIISIKHRGLTDITNLALACFFCNNRKGTDLGTLTEYEELIRFYHPRKDSWSDHFEIDKHFILPKTDIAQGTINILGINDEDRLAERMAFYEAGFFPHPNALRLIS